MKLPSVHALVTLAPACLILSIATLVPSGARAQCTSEWSSGFDHVQVSLAVVASARFDDGTGPALYFTTETDTNGDATVWKWNGTALTSIGLLDGSPFTPEGEGNALCVFDDGTGPALYVGGFFFDVSNVTASGVARWNGTSWSAVGQSIHTANSLAVFDDGTGAHLYAGHDGANVARWDGSTWTPVGSSALDNGEYFVRTLAVHDDGTGPALYAGGHFLELGGVAANNIARFDGTTWNALGAGTNNTVLSLATFNDGSGSKLHVGGGFTQAGGVTVNYVARWDGSIWSPLGSGMSNFSTVRSLCVFDDGTGRALYAGGSIFMAGGVIARGIARWNGTTWSPVGSGMDGNGNLSTLTVHDDGTGPALFAGGGFHTAGGLPAPYLAKWKSSGWSRIEPGQGFQGRGRAFLVRDEPSGRALYCAGQFSVAGDVAANHIARFDGAQWSALGMGLNGGSGGEVSALAEYDDGSGFGKQIYAGGSFSAHDAPNSIGIAKWNGTLWSGLGSGTQNSGTIRALCVFDDGQGPELYAGGTFTQMNGVQAQYIAKWNGSAWSSVGGTTMGNLANMTVNALAVWDDGQGPALYVGGYFNGAGGTGGPANLARWKNGAWSSVGAPTGQVNALLAWNDGSGDKLYIAGSLISLGGVAVNDVGWFDGTSFGAVGGGFTGSLVSVTSLAVFDEGSGSVPRLYAGGGLGTVGGVVKCDVARFDGNTWAPVGDYNNSSGSVSALVGFDAGNGPGLFAAGPFHLMSGKPSEGIARFASSCPDPVAFCYGTASACPCGNAGAPGNGCATSLGAGANLSASGGASIANDSLVLAGSGTSNSVLTYFQGTTRVNSGAGAVFGDGLRCAGGSVIRLGAVLASGGVSQYPSAGNQPVSVRGQVTTAGAKRTYQIWFRNAASFCTPSTFNLSNGLEVTWGP